jgi:hypothetical protein
MNYDRQLLSMSQEVQHWERLRMQVPYIAMEIQAQREKYRVLRDNMLMLVHDYNKVSITTWCELHTAFSPDARAAITMRALCAAESVFAIVRSWFAGADSAGQRGTSVVR